MCVPDAKGHWVNIVQTTCTLTVGMEQCPNDPVCGNVANVVSKC